MQSIWNTKKITDLLEGHLQKPQLLSMPAKQAANPKQHYTGFCIDSRQIKFGEIFVALQTEADDGHRYLEQVVLQGAAGALVCAENSHVKKMLQSSRVWQQRKKKGTASSPSSPVTAFTFFLVKDPLAALQHLASEYRKELSLVFGITGSNGKTTACQYLQRILGVLAGEDQVCASPRSFNNHLGVPLSILRASPKQQFLILEMGMNAPNEIRRLTGIARPDHAIITSVSQAHGGFFLNVSQIAKAKLEIIEGLPIGGSLSYHYSSPGLKQAQSLCAQKELNLDVHDSVSLDLDLELELELETDMPVAGARAGKGGGSGARNGDGTANDRNYPNDHRCTFLSFCGWRPEGITFSYAIGSLGSLENPVLARGEMLARNLCHKVHLTNIAAILNLLSRVGYSEKEIIRACQEVDFAALPGRFEMHSVSQSTVLIDDSYNANPASFLAALQSCREMFATGKLALFAGEMKELGALSKLAHQQIAEQAAKLQYDLFAVSGQDFATLMKKRFLKISPQATSVCADDPLALFAAVHDQEQAAALLSQCQAILVKGSRAANMDVIVKKFLNR